MPIQGQAWQSLGAGLQVGGLAASALCCLCGFSLRMASPVSPGWGTGDRRAGLSPLGTGLRGLSGSLERLMALKGVTAQWLPPWLSPWHFSFLICECSCSVVVL